MTTATADAGLYGEIQAFYAHHMRLVDDGHVDAWGETFTHDATISNNANPRPAHGRDAIVAVIRRAHAELAARGVQHRHWMGMTTVEPIDEHTVRATSYALLMAVGKDRAPQIDRSTACVDEIVRTEGRWQIRDRRVRHDALPA
ncbi:nuclear transport factor 2 family protein [Streptantibioticus silvisoli]|uniref:Nuclear transport factor 2 family protein n=1 Tax=Streptantibioticus silvisoli TaxID=2705255 RepID=A0ABT6W9A0_9ACTN|nr:nuclear transport factor 2 family protein [Streptantibioticus silvisoli]MDI5967334.1 nuclear transport factor 2 family protein [Streptantibioticus silvisoli]